MKFKIKKLTVYEFIILCLVISTISVRIKYFMYISQGFFLLYSLMYIKRNKPIQKYNKFNIVSILFVIFSSLSILWAVNTRDAISSTISIIQIYSISLILFISTNNESQYLFIKKCFYIAGWVILLYILIATPLPAWRAMLSENKNLSASTDRLGPSIGMHTNFCGNILTILIMFAIEGYYRTKSKWALLQGILLFICVMFTKSRMALMASLIGGFAYISLCKKISLKQFGKIILSVFFLTIILLISLNNEFLYSLYGNRLESLLNVTQSVDKTDDSVLGRMKLINKAIEVFKKHVLVGVGIGNFSNYNEDTGGVSGYYAHNNFLELLADLGIIGFLLYYIPYFWGIKDLKNYLKKIKDKQRSEIIFLLVLLLIRLIMDYAQVSYLYDSSQLILAFTFIKLKLLVKNE